jgi:hypothetical protein
MEIRQKSRSTSFGPQRSQVKVLVIVEALVGVELADAWALTRAQLRSHIGCLVTQVPKGVIKRGAGKVMHFCTSISLVVRLQVWKLGQSTLKPRNGR